MIVGLTRSVNGPNSKPKRRRPWPLTRMHRALGQMRPRYRWPRAGGCPSARAAALADRPRDPGAEPRADTPDRAPGPASARGVTASGPRSCDNLGPGLLSRHAGLGASLLARAGGAPGLPGLADLRTNAAAAAADRPGGGGPAVPVGAACACVAAPAAGYANSRKRHGSGDRAQWMTSQSMAARRASEDARCFLAGASGCQSCLILSERS